MKKSLQFLVVLFVLLGCIGCDQAVKALARGALAFSPPVLLLNGAVRLQYTENPGAFLSLGAGLPAGVRYLFGVVLVGVTQLALFAFLIRSRNLTTLQRIGFSLFLAGAVITSLTAFLGLWFGHRVLRIPRDVLVGTIAGVHTQPAALAFALPW